MSFTWRKNVSMALCSVMLAGVAGCASMGNGGEDSDRIEPTQTSMSASLQCLGQAINKKRTKQLVLFVQPIGNSTITPNSLSTDLTLAGKSFVRTAVFNHIQSNKILFPEIDLPAFVKRYKKKLPDFALVGLTGSFTEFKPTHGAGTGVAGEASQDRTGGRASGDWNSESARLALDVSLINIASGFTVDNVSLSTAVNKNRSGFTLMLGAGNGGVGLNIGSFETDSVHSKQRALVEAAVYILIARRFKISESQCAAAQGAEPTSPPQPGRQPKPGSNRRQRAAG